MMTTRDDAQTATLAIQIQAATKEVISYYTSQGGEINFSKLPDSSQIVLNRLIHYGWVKVIDDNHSVVYSDRDNQLVCLNYYTNGKIIKLEQNQSNNTSLCDDLKRVIKDANYSVLNNYVKF
jgi:hypothetical protein